MHTPRFSGQPIRAGDLVLTWTASRPIRTNCENVGTVFSSSLAAAQRPSTGAQNFSRRILQRYLRRGSRKAHAHICARADNLAERSTANPEKPPARLRTHSRRENYSSGIDSERLT